jgi:hypothetical protein
MLETSIAKDRNTITRYISEAGGYVSGRGHTLENRGRRLDPSATAEKSSQWMRAELTPFLCDIEWYVGQRCTMRLFLRVTPDTTWRTDIVPVASKTSHKI